MMSTTVVRLISFVTPLVVASGVAYAAGTHADSHDKAKDHAGGHQHDSWVAPPKEYASLKSNIWDDAAAAQRGEQIYKQQCTACHGADGKGKGPAGAGLEHPPADLTNHFHEAPGKGDGYLYWRVSEGGIVEPFLSSKSAMPPFKGTLTEADRWDVLIYVHQKFHGGFSQKSSNDTMPHTDGAKGHGH